MTPRPTIYWPPGYPFGLLTAQLLPLVLFVVMPSDTFGTNLVQSRCKRANDTY